jgi:NADPH:quinone reductase-like Zn-dependent oxidoreductase
MRAAICTRYGPPDVLQVREVPAPVPSSHEVLIKVHAAAVTASDCYIRSGVPTARFAFRAMIRIVVGFRRPRRAIIGMVMAGEIAAVGKRVKRFAVGDRVYGSTVLRMGCYAEYVCMPEGGVVSLAPSNLTLDEAAAIPYGALIALFYLTKANIQRGQRVLVYGASGAVGTAAVQLAKHFGAEVIAVCSSANVDLVKSLGADMVLDYTKDHDAPAGARDAIMFDAVGGRKTSRLKVACREAIASDAQYFTVDKDTPWFRRESLVTLTQLVEAGVLRPVVDRVYDLSEIAESHRYAELGHKRGNVLVKIAGGRRPA